jgi:ubiquinone/menaquinone biosynthesis C-methylase UbiE
MQDHDQNTPRRPHPLIDRARQTRMARAQSLRTARHHAGYLLPYLRAGMDLLDAGCGPGSITTELARLVAPGTAIGIDRPHATLPERPGREASSARFVVADVCALPFADASFDAVHAHALFQHLADPFAALRELRRVLRPGGVIGLADWDRELLFLHPRAEPLERSFAWLAALRRSEGGDPQAGRMLAERLTRAGFERPAMHVVAEALATRRSALETGETWARTFEDASTRARLLALGVVSEAELDGLPAAWRDWARSPGAFMLAHWFCAVAFA